MNTFSFLPKNESFNANSEEALETKALLSNNMIKMFNTFKEYDIVLKYIYN